MSATSVAFAPVKEKFIDVAGCRVRYLTGGNGPALVLIHGLLAYSFSWRFNLEALTQHATVFAPDMPGMGFSQRLQNPEPGLAPTAQTILDFMKAVGVPSATLLGSSHGGGAVILAAPLAAQQGIKIEKIIRYCCCTRWNGTGHRSNFLSFRTSILILFFIFFCEQSFFCLICSCRRCSSRIRPAGLCPPSECTSGGSGPPCSRARTRTG